MSDVALVILGGAGTQKGSVNATANTAAIRDNNGGLTAAGFTGTQLNLNGPLISGFATKTSAYGVNGGVGGDNVIEIDTTSGSVTVTLPSPATVGAGYEILLIKKVSANNLVIAPNAAETINGASSKTISAQYAMVLLVCNGTNWYAGQLTVL